MRVVADRHLPLLHHLEQRRLHLGRRAVDLVGEQEVAEDRAFLGVEAAGVGAVDARADEVARHEIRCELHPPERAAEHRGGGLDRQRLGEAGDALDQEVASRDEAHEHALEHLVLARDHALDLDQRLLELGAVVGGLGCLRGLGIGHRLLLLSGVRARIRVDPGGCDAGESAVKFRCVVHCPQSL